MLEKLEQYNVVLQASFLNHSCRSSFVMHLSVSPSFFVKLLLGKKKCPLKVVNLNSQENLLNNSPFQSLLFPCGPLALYEGFPLYTILFHACHTFFNRVNVQAFPLTSLISWYALVHALFLFSYLWTNWPFSSLQKVIEVLKSQSETGGLHENTFLLVMGDHGQTINGDHGGGGPEEVNFLF